MDSYYETREIVISDRFVVQLVLDDCRIIAARVFDAYADDLIPEGRLATMCVRAALKAEAVAV